VCAWVASADGAECDCVPEEFVRAITAWPAEDSAASSAKRHCSSAAQWLVDPAAFQGSSWWDGVATPQDWTTAKVAERIASMESEVLPPPEPEARTSPPTEEERARLRALRPPKLPPPCAEWDSAPETRRAKPAADTTPELASCTTGPLFSDSDLELSSLPASARVSEDCSARWRRAFTAWAAVRVGEDHCVSAPWAALPELPDLSATVGMGNIAIRTHRPMQTYSGSDMASHISSNLVKNGPYRICGQDVSFKLDWGRDVNILLMQDGPRFDVGVCLSYVGFTHRRHRPRVPMIVPLGSDKPSTEDPSDAPSTPKPDDCASDAKASPLLTSLRSHLANFLLLIARPKPGDVVYDPMCGSGIIPCEAEALGLRRNAQVLVTSPPPMAFAVQLPGQPPHSPPMVMQRPPPTLWDLCPPVVSLGSDIDPVRALSWEGFGAPPEPAFSILDVPVDEGARPDLARCDIAHLPFRDGSIDVLLTDLPYGNRGGSIRAAAALPAPLLREASRIVRPGTGRIVLFGNRAKPIAQALMSDPSLLLAKVLTIDHNSLVCQAFLIHKLSPEDTAKVAASGLHIHAVKSIVGISKRDRRFVRRQG
jgi:SAM-dependent methyltransferase